MESAGPCWTGFMKSFAACSVAPVGAAFAYSGKRQTAKRRCSWSLCCRALLHVHAMKHASTTPGSHSKVDARISGLAMSFLCRADSRICSLSTTPAATSCSGADVSKRQPAAELGTSDSARVESHCIREQKHLLSVLFFK